jgi:hypothetical protein
MVSFMQLSQLKNASQSNKKKASPLAKKWQAIQRQINQNLSLQKKMQTFYEYYEKQLRGDEERFLTKRTELVEHFCGFIPRKTIVNTAIDNLLDFIEGEMQLIAQHPFGDDDNLMQLYKLKIDKLQERQDKYSTDPKVMNTMRDYLESMPWMPDNLSDEEISEFIRNPDMADKMIDERFKQWKKENPEHAVADGYPQDEEDEDWLNEDDAFFNDFFGNETDDDVDSHNPFQSHQQLEESEQLLKQLMKSGEINKLYKKLANLLHPDKLKDKSKQAEYLAAMKELITARKNKDLFSLLSLAQRYLPDHDLAIDKKQEKQLSLALDIKLKDLQAEYLDMANSPTNEAKIWCRFHDKNKRQQEKNLEEQRHWVERMIEDTDIIIANTSNVKNLKAYLRDFNERMNRESMSVLTEMFNEFDRSPIDGDFDDPFDEKFDYSDYGKRAF